MNPLSLQIMITIACVSQASRGLGWRSLSEVCGGARPGCRRHLLVSLRILRLASCTVARLSGNPCSHLSHCHIPTTISVFSFLYRHIISQFRCITMSAATVNTLGLDPALEEPPAFAIFLPDVVQERMLELKAPDGSVTRAARTEQQVVQEMVDAWEANRAVRLATYQQRRKDIIDAIKLAQAQQAQADAEAAADAAAELRRLAEEEQKKLPQIPDITNAGMVPDTPTLRPCAHAVQSVVKRRPVKPQFFAEKVIRAQLAAGTHSADSDTFKYGDLVITLDGTSTNKSGDEAKAVLNFRDWVGLTKVFAACALTAGYRKSFCDAWVSLPLKLSHHDEYYNHEVYEDRCIIIYLHEVWNESWTMIAGHNADPLYPIFNPGLVSVNRLEKILKKLMQDETLAIMLVPFYSYVIVLTFANFSIPNTSLPPPFFLLITLSLPLITYQNLITHQSLCPATHTISCAGKTAVDQKHSEPAAVKRGREESDGWRHYEPRPDPKRQKPPQTQSFRSHTSDDRCGDVCILCGSRTQSYLQKNSCEAENLVTGGKTIVRRDHELKWVIKANPTQSVCWKWNTQGGCRHDQHENRGMHICSLCGRGGCGAQQCHRAEKK
jgi:hypothetical protein